MHDRAQRGEVLPDRSLRPRVRLLGGAGLLLGGDAELSGVAPAVVAGILGTAAFTALGLLLAGTLRAEARPGEGFQVEALIPLEAA